ncbi:hypothetical protein IKN40_06610, partial [bacterium]|nr:hypothetical protein [bacterium]
MVTTEYEYNNISLYRSQNMNEFGPQVDPSCDYVIFNDEIQDALYTLGYCTLYDSTYMQTFPESDRSLNRYEKAMHIINFADSSKDKITSMIQTEYIVFIYLYSYTFLGE